MVKRKNIQVLCGGKLNEKIFINIIIRNFNNFNMPDGFV